MWKAKNNKVPKEVRGSGVEMLISGKPKHQLTLFRLGKPKMVLRRKLPSIPYKGAKDCILQT
jgi:hypothetical protein